MCKPSFEKLIQVSQVYMSMEEHMNIEETEYLNLQRLVEGNVTKKEPKAGLGASTNLLQRRS